MARNVLRLLPTPSYILGVGLRLVVLVALLILTDHRRTVVAILTIALAIYFVALQFPGPLRRRRDLLMMIGDLPLLLGLVNFAPHAWAVEAVVPAWLVTTSFISTRRGTSAPMLPLAFGAWLGIAIHAVDTPSPWGYALTHLAVIGFTAGIITLYARERGRHRRDVLTPVLSRRAGIADLEEALNDGRALNVAFVDLRGFKQVNDRFGHAVGDEVLREVARRLQASVRPGDIVFRYGGDEFIVASESPELQTRVREVFTEPVAVRGRNIPVDARVGVRPSDPKLGLHALLAEADRLMYQDRRDAPSPDGDASSGPAPAT